MEEEVCYAREYATPANALHDMAQLPFAGLNKEAMNKQARQFAEFSEKIMQHPKFNEKFGDIRDRCEIVYFDDEEKDAREVTAVLEERLKKCIEGNSTVLNKSREFGDGHRQMSVSVNSVVVLCRGAKRSERMGSMRGILG